MRVKRSSEQMRVRSAPRGRLPSGPLERLEQSRTLRALPDQMVHGDCCEYLPLLHSATVDLVVTDPPYGLQSDTTIVRRNSRKFGRSTDIQPSFAWDVRPQLIWVSECLRVLKPGGTLIAFYEREHLHEVIAEARRHGGILRDIGAWHKTNPVPQVRKAKWASAL